MTLDVKKIEFVTSMVVEIAHKTMLLEAYKSEIGNMNESAIHVQHMDVDPESPAGQKPLPNDRHPLVSGALQGIISLRGALVESAKRLETEIAATRQRLYPLFDEAGYHGHLQVADYNFVERLLQERVAAAWKAEVALSREARSRKPAVAG